MSDLSSSCKKTYTLKGLDREDLNLLVSGLSWIKDTLGAADLDRMDDLLGVMK